MHAPTADDLHLLSEPDFSALSPQEQKDALVAAYYRGCDVLEDKCSDRRVAGGWPALDRVLPEEWLEHPAAAAYHREVVLHALAERIIDRETEDRWRQALRRPDGARDPRVQSFLDGWRSRGRDIARLQRRTGLR
ncbi:MAG TPA: hypothetical protein VFQ45_00070 [Longimicrobium sp.]|nr:hypothetical protein [Longimicrobium sp.]